MFARTELQALLLTTVVALPAAAQQPDIRVDRLPRPTAHSPAATKIGEALAQQDAGIHKEAEDCRQLASDPGQVEYHVGARRLLETSTLYSIEVAKDWYCGGAHPESDAFALTFDLRTGAAYELSKAFHVGTQHIDSAVAPIVIKHLPKDCGLDDDSLAQTLRDADLSLGVTKQYLIFYFRGVPRAVAACFPPAQVPLDELSNVADRQELQRVGPPLAGD